MTEISPLLTPAEVARVLKVSRSKVYQMVARQELPSVRVGALRRIRPADLEAYLESLTREVATDRRRS